MLFPCYLVALYVTSFIKKKKKKSMALMLCFTTQMLQVNTLTLFNFAVLCWSHWTNTVCFDCTTQLLLSPYMWSLCCYCIVVWFVLAKSFFLAACLCLSFLIWTNLSKQMNHWLLFTHLCFCFQALLLLKLFVVATDFLFKIFLC